MIWFLFAPLTLWFWLLLFLATSLIILALEHEDEGQGITWATITMIVTILLLFFFGAKQPILDALSFVVQRPGVTLIIIAGYILAGVIWSFIKWFRYIHKEKDAIIAEYKGKTEKKAGQFQIEIASRIKNNLDALDNKSRIMGWMVYWPISFMWNFLNDPIRRLFSFIFKKIKGIYQKMTNKMESNIYTELGIKEKIEPGD